MTKILICTPIVTGIGPKASLSMAAMYKHIGASTSYKTSEWMPGPRKSPREIRNRAAVDAVRLGATHVFFRDDDILAPPNIIDMLLQVGKPIVGALIHNSEGLPLVWDGDWESELTFPDHPTTGAFPCWAVAMGAMLIKTEVFRKLSPPWFWFDKTQRTMDVNFCRSAQERGIEVWCSVEAGCRQIVHEEREI